MKFLSIFLLIFKLSFSFATPTTLVPGDIAIIGFNFSNPDEFSFITFQDLGEGTVIYFTDCGWKSNHTFKTGEGLITYTVPTGGKNAFDVISYPSNPGFATAGISGFFGFAVSGDQIIAFQGSFDAPSFIFALNNYQSSWQANADDNNSSSLPDNLINGTTAIAVNFGADGLYNCAAGSSRDKDIVLQSISDPTNWNTSADRVSLPGNCFQGSLPVAFQNFSITKEENYYKVNIAITSETNWKVVLEESEDGIYFTETNSEGISYSTSNVEFHVTSLKKYCRLKAEKEGQAAIYSEIKTLGGNKITLAELFVYNIEGNLIYTCTECATFNNDLLKRRFPNMPLFIRKYYSDGSIKVEKMAYWEQ